MTSSLPTNQIARWLLVLLLLAGVYFFHSFVVPLLAALIIAFATWPSYQRLVHACRGRTAVAASGAITIVLLVIVIPCSFLLSFAVSEITSGVTYLVQANKEGIPMPKSIPATPFVGKWLEESWKEYLAKPNGLGEVIQLLSGEHLGNISRWAFATGRGTLNLLLSVVFILIILFFAYKDGSKIVAQIDLIGEHILPRRWERFSRVVPATVSSTVTGMTIIALGEGVVLGSAYHIAGAPSAFLLGVITAFMALIPGGAPLAMTSVSLYLAASGREVAGLFLFLWGAIELFVVDKTIRPKLVGGPIRLPFIPTFFGLIGGVKTMGMVGLFVGPVLMALLVAIWREWLLTTQSEIVAEAAAKIEPTKTPREEIVERKQVTQVAIHAAGDTGGKVIV